MQINGIAAGYADPAALEKRAEPNESLVGQLLGSAEKQRSGAASRTAAMAEVLSQYDVTDISPGEFSQMLQKLYDSGTLSEEELQQLSAIRVDLEAAGVEADESIDLLEFYTEKIEKMQRDREFGDAQTARQELGPLLKRLDWLEKFSVIQEAPDAAGLDAII